MVRAAIFDLDGVIVNTVPLHFKAWQKMFKQYGHDFTMQDYLTKVDGRPRLEGAAAILTELTPDEVKKAGEIKQTYYLELLDQEPVEVFDSTVAVVRELKKQKIKLAVASSSKNTARVLQKIGLIGVFDVNVSAADFVKGKPDPEIFLTAAEKLGVKPEESVVVEDAKSGVEAAQRGGFFCIALDRHHDPAALKGADLIIKDLSQISAQQIINMGAKVS